MKIPFWELIFPVTISITLLINLVLYNTIKKVDQILLKLYLSATETANSIPFSYDNYLQNLHDLKNDFLHIDDKKFDKIGNSKISNSVNFLSHLRGGDNFGNALKNLRQTKTVRLIGIETKTVAVSILCGGVKAATYHVVKEISDLKYLNFEDIIGIKKCLDLFCRTNKVNFVQRALDKSFEMVF